MVRNRGFKLGHRVVRPLTRFTTRTAISRLLKWGRSLRNGTKRLCFLNQDGSDNYIRVGQVLEKQSLKVPKGHLALYVGEEDGDKCRVIVPVLFFNHPLFADLLREAEEVYGFDHPGGVQIPCPKSKFEDVKMKMTAAGDGGSRRGRRSWRQLLMSSRRFTNSSLDH